ncbi:retinoic acid early-inducible protein 1-beta-like [Apodemus sylvaticus]|uniref:retinoic acid early-inducible protein 1-beta-like n=1 Tax=Apodemus sylvaticus TaxID=10129 RepID=UPI002244B395|nr:retinoic acid early-inducible protein 1-beta-like [Apodemus sylvaticus]
MTFCSHCGTYLHTSLTDTYSLSCNLIIKTEEHLWCVAQCSVDEILFLQFDNKNKATPLGNLGKMANATEVRSCLTEHLENLCQELRNKVEKSLGYPTLQATMLSQHSHGLILSACWQFNISEKYFFTLDTVTTSWRPTNAVSGDITYKSKGDEDLTRHLTFSIAEGSQKLNEFFKQHKEKPRSTPRSPDITQVTSPTQLPPTGHFPYKEVFIPVGLIFFIICICLYVKKKCCTQGGFSSTHTANAACLNYWLTVHLLLHANVGLHLTCWILGSRTSPLQFTQS